MAANVIVNIITNPDNSMNSKWKTTESGIEYQNPNGSTENSLQIGYVGQGILSDGSHMLSGIYNGSGTSELDPNSWDNLITN